MHVEISENSMLWSMAKIKENTVMKLPELKSKRKSSDKKKRNYFHGCPFLIRVGRIKSQYAKEGNSMAHLQK